MDDAPLILVIEDSPVTLRLITKTLQLSGFRTRAADCAFQAVAAARRERPDVIVADVGLPDLDGATATSLLRDHSEFRDVPVILVSALPATELREKMAATGATETLSKPFTPGELVRCVRRQLAARAGPPI